MAVSGVSRRYLNGALLKLTPEVVKMTTTVIDPDNSQPGLLDDYWTKDEFADVMNKSPRTIQRWRAMGKGPAVTKLPGGQEIIRHETGRKWLRGLEEES